MPEPTDTKRGLNVGTLEATDHASVNVGDVYRQSQSEHYVERDSYGNVTNLYQYHIHNYHPGQHASGRWHAQQPSILPFAGPSYTSGYQLPMRLYPAISPPSLLMPLRYPATGFSMAPSAYTIPSSIFRPDYMAQYHAGRSKELPLSPYGSWAAPIRHGPTAMVTNATFFDERDYKGDMPKRDVNVDCDFIKTTYAPSKPVTPAEGATAGAAGMSMATKSVTGLRSVDVDEKRENESSQPNDRPSAVREKRDGASTYPRDDASQGSVWDRKPYDAKGKSKALWSAVAAKATPVKPVTPIVKLPPRKDKRSKLLNRSDYVQVSPYTLTNLSLATIVSALQDLGHGAKLDHIYDDYFCLELEMRKTTRAPAGTWKVRRSMFQDLVSSGFTPVDAQAINDKVKDNNIVMVTVHVRTESSVPECDHSTECECW